jgi:adenosylcobinamide kinase / adenosylcobinamide-phosphate guanylyltransferase
MYSTNNKIILLIGGARSGKSTRAQEMAMELGTSVLFCATAEPLDDEMLARIELHKKSRPANWDTIESSRNIGLALAKTVSNYDTVILDCITLLVANCLGDNTTSSKVKQDVSSEITALTDLMAKRQTNYILVSNEVGSGLVPDNKLGRTYRDTLGQVNQQLAKCADEVYFMAAGLSLKMK